MKILVADDDRVLNHLLTSRLRMKGCQVITAFDAMQAFMGAMRTIPDAIVLDIHMPGGTGIEALKKLKMSAKTSQIPVVVLSGSMDAPAAETLVRELGAVDFIAKPVDPEAVYVALMRALEQTAVSRGDRRQPAAPRAQSHAAVPHFEE